MAVGCDVPLVIRGRVIDTPTAAFGGRGDGMVFHACDVAEHLDELALSAPSAMADLYTLSFDDILDFLHRLGERLQLADNAYLQEAFRVSCLTSGLSESILRHHYKEIPFYFHRDVVAGMAEGLVGIDFLEGWVERPSGSPGVSVAVRAFGARCVHVIAGNVPAIGVMTIVRNAFTRSDAIIKSPSNDPLTALAVARTMIDMAPDHPLTRHLSVAYWKGGDDRVESYLYDPMRIEKLVAWGGLASIRHITRYLQPGIDLITLDPKHSATIIGREAFADEATLAAVAVRLAVDIGMMNQEACMNARVVYVESGTDAAGLARINRLGEMTYRALRALPEHVSTPHKRFHPELRDELDALQFVEDEYRLIGGGDDGGAIIVSQHDMPVDFSAMLACRVGNLVPLDNAEQAVRYVNAYTQTIGIWPDTLKRKLRNALAWQGTQRLVSLGGTYVLGSPATPQDGIEPVRRMCKWIVDETGEALDKISGLPSVEAVARG